jgi:SAM-dependent methyltransferase
LVRLKSIRQSLRERIASPFSVQRTEGPMSIGPGFLDEVTLRSIRGWGCDDSGRPVDLIVSINGKKVCRFRTWAPRPDLGREIGFDVELDRSLAPGDVLEVVTAGGKHLSGSPYRVDKLRPTRQEKVLWGISRNMRILEIGPSYNPVAPRAAGWRSFSLDHASQEELRDKYRGMQPIERIEPVDYIWKGGPLEGAIPTEQHGTFDAIIASHVIEHFPDPLAFFFSAAAILSEAGRISLAIPDKRFMFDFFKPVTQTSDYLYAHFSGRTRHSKKTAFDNIALNVREGQDYVWSRRLVGNFGFFGRDVLRDAYEIFNRTEESEADEYVDYHNSVYTPSSFELIIFELGQLEILPFAIENRFPTSGCEFYVTLRKCKPARLDPDALAAERLRLMKAVIRELGDQARYLETDES